MAVGALAALLGRRSDNALRNWWWRGLIAVTVFLGTALLAYAKGPDWMWMYFLEPPDLSLFDLAFLSVMVYYVPYGAGFALSRRLDRQMGRSGGFLALACSLILNIYVLARLFDRYAHVGTRADYLAGRAAFITGDHPLKGTLNLGGATLAITAVVLIALAFRESRAARAASG